MIILRQKNYALDSDTSALTPRDLQLENMKMQRQIMINQRTREKLEADRVKTRMKEIQTAQRIDQKRDEQENKNRLQVQRLQQTEDIPRNVSLYKSKSRTVNPVSMPK